MRCSALANALIDCGATVSWLTATPDHVPADLDGSVERVVMTDETELADALASRGIRHLVADWKETNPQRVSDLRRAGVHITLVGNFLHGAVPDLHVRQGFLPGLSPSGAPALSGPKYLLLPRSCRALPPRRVAERPQRVLLSLGGTTTPLLARLQAQISAEFPDLALEWRGPAQAGPVHPLVEALQQTDIGILAGGTTLHEAAATGLPTVCLPIVASQFDRAEQFESAGLGVSLNPVDPGFEHQFAAVLQALVADTHRRRDMARKGQALVDGDGAIRVASHLCALATGASRESQ